MESLLDAIFAPSQSAGKYVDPLNRIFEEMMSFSLLAFNEASFSSSSSSLASTVAWSSEGGGATPSKADDVVATAPVPIAAENALDVALATLAKQSINRSDSVADAVVSSPMFPDSDKLHDRLIRLSSGLLTEARDSLRSGGMTRPRITLSTPTLTSGSASRVDSQSTAPTCSTILMAPRWCTPDHTPHPATHQFIHPSLMSHMSNGDHDSGCLEAVRKFFRAMADRTLQVSPRHVVVVVGGTDSDPKDVDNDDEDDDNKEEKAGTRGRALFS
jgi:hypothetical protein